MITPLADAKRSIYSFVFTYWTWSSWDFETCKAGNAIGWEGETEGPQGKPILQGALFSSQWNSGNTLPADLGEGSPSLPGDAFFCLVPHWLLYDKPLPGVFSAPGETLSAQGVLPTARGQSVDTGTCRVWNGAQETSVLGKRRADVLFWWWLQPFNRVQNFAECLPTLCQALWVLDHHDLLREVTMCKGSMAWQNNYRWGLVQ